MKQINCLNLCEILPYLLKKRRVDKLLEDASRIAQFGSVERIYVGSSFCGNYFLQQSDKTLKELIALCKDKNIKATLVIPAFSEGDLELGKKRIAQIVEMGKGFFDEFTGNDVGILSHLNVYPLDINLGRLFMKDYRDPRYQEYFQIPWKPKMFTDYFKRLLQEYKIAGVEFDTTHKIMDFAELPEGITAGIHAPYCYQTVGRICEYASIQKEIVKKYRPNDTCHTNCADHLIRYTVSDGNIEYVRFGRAVYFKHPGYELRNLEKYRLIYFPFHLN